MSITVLVCFRPVADSHYYVYVYVCIQVTKNPSNAVSQAYTTCTCMHLLDGVDGRPNVA